MQNQTQPQAASANTISLLLGFPDPTTLDTPQFQDAVRSVMASPRIFEALQYGDEQGNFALINFLIERINREQNLSIQPDQLMIVAGSTHAVDMIARLCAKPGGSVIVEAPTYSDSLHIFRDQGVTIHSVPVDENGIIVEALQALLESPSATQNPPNLLYTIPNFHNPTGFTLSAERRFQILELACQYNLTIVEDDVYRDLAFESPNPPSFYALAGGMNAIQIGSFSKTLAPGLRLGWVVASAELIQSFVYSGTTQMSGGANPFVAQIVAEYCRQGHWEPHIEHLRNVYRTRRDTLLTALARYMPSGVTWTTPMGGYFVWVTLPENVLARDIKQRAAERGVLVAAGENYFVNSTQGEHNLRLTYSFAALEELETAVQILAEIIVG
ncbi:MAG: PLP-dependent aminotransferase family protein [Chloroflexota bacterium]